MKLLGIFLFSACTGMASVTNAPLMNKPLNESLELIRGEQTVLWDTNAETSDLVWQELEPGETVQVQWKVNLLDKTEELPPVFAYTSGKGLLEGTNVLKVIPSSNRYAFVFTAGIEEGPDPVTLLLDEEHRVLPFHVGGREVVVQEERTQAPPGGWGRAEILRKDGTLLEPINRQGFVEQLPMNPLEEVSITLYKNLPEGTLIYAYTVHGGWVNGLHRNALKVGPEGKIEFDFKVAEFGGDYPLILRYLGREEVLNFWVDLKEAKESSE